MTAVGRAWLVGHRAYVGVSLLIAVTAGTVLFAEVRVESVYASARFPVWGMYAPTMAAIVGTMCASRLPAPWPRDASMMLARLSWALLLVTAAAAGAVAVAAVADYRPMVREAAVLGAITIALSCVVGRASVALGLGLDGAVVTMGSDSRFVGLEFWYSGLGSLAKIWIVVGAAMCVLGYALLGARDGPPETQADD